MLYRLQLTDIKASLMITFIKSSWREKSDCPFSVHVAEMLHILKCHRGSGGQRKIWPSRWSGCRLRYFESTRCSSRNQRLNMASMVWMEVPHRELSLKIQKHNSSIAQMGKFLCKKFTVSIHIHGIFYLSLPSLV